MKEPHGEVVSALESVERIVCVTAERGDHRAAAKQRETCFGEYHAKPPWKQKPGKWNHSLSIVIARNVALNRRL